jgi:hypothetical protein
MGDDDSGSASGNIASESTLLTERIERLRSERAKITESRLAATIEVDLQRAQPGAAAVWRATSGCRDVTLASSGDACAAVLALRQALQTAQRRDALDNDLLEAEKQLKNLPAVSVSDPQADTAADLVKWATLGMINLTTEDIRIARIAGMTLMPQIAGLVLMLAAALWQSRPRKICNYLAEPC